MDSGDLGCPPKIVGPTSDERNAPEEIAMKTFQVDGYATQTVLIKKMGWTLGLIQTFLKDPDSTRPNPKYRSAAPVKLFELLRVKQIEATAAFQEALSAAQRRSTAAKRAAAARSEAARAAIEQARANEEANKALQIAGIDALEGEALVRRALECMHALNRLAKHWRSHAAVIYEHKDRFLTVMVLSGRATVGSFMFRDSRPRQTCSRCRRSWMGDSYCLVCDTDTGIASAEPAQWFLIDCGNGYKFHQPGGGKQFEAVALPIAPHDPTQPRREVPHVGLSHEAQLHCIQRATDYLRTLVNHPSSSDVGTSVTQAAGSADLISD